MKDQDIKWWMLRKKGSQEPCLFFSSWDEAKIYAAKALLEEFDIDPVKLIFEKIHESTSDFNDSK